MTHWTDALVRLGACPEAVEWCRTHLYSATAWRVCQRGDWMAWFLRVLARQTPWGSPERRRFAGVSAEVLITLARLFSNERTDAAIDGTITLFVRYERGEEVTETEFAAAAADAAEAAGVAGSAEAAWAAEAAWSAAAELDAGSAEAAEAAAVAATWTISWEASWGFSLAAQYFSLAASADIIRARYPKPPKLRRRR